MAAADTLKDRRFTLDEEPVAIDDFLQDNPNLLTDAVEYDAIAHLMVGQSITYGGGAGADFTLTRTH